MTQEAKDRLHTLRWQTHLSDEEREEKRQLDMQYAKELELK